MAKKLHLGIIGFGTIGKVHLNAASLCSQFIPSSISDLHYDPKIIGLTYSRDYHVLLNDPSIDAVSICTPPASHYSILIDAIQAKKHVLVEKPPVLTYAQYQHIKSLATYYDRTVYMSFHAQHNPAVIHAARFLRLEKIKEITINYSEYVHNYHSPESWIFTQRISGGGVLMDSGINAISLLTKIFPNALLGRINSVSLSFPKTLSVESKADVSFLFDNTIPARLRMNWFDRDKEVRTIEFYTTEGDIHILDLVDQEFRINNVSRVTKLHENAMVDQVIEYQGVFNEFAQCISTNISHLSWKETGFILEIYNHQQSQK